MKSAEAIPLITPDPVMVRVTAPSNLEAGYKFDAVYNGEVFQVTVPAGGVRSGQSFEVPFVPMKKAVAVATIVQIPQHEPTSEATPMLSTAASHDSANGNCNQRSTPLGEWKTGLFDCFSHGFHPSLINAMCCPQILMAQVLTRMKLGCCGLPDPNANAYKNVTASWIIGSLVVWYFRTKWKSCADVDTISSSQLETLKVITDKHGHQKILDRHVDVPFVDAAHSHCKKSTKSDLQTLNWIWFWMTVLVLARLRQAVRKKHAVAGYTPLGFFEDLLCAFYCGCCTVSQLARETANYGTERAYFLSSTGMADEWTERWEEFEQKHQKGHHLVHAHAAGDQPHAHNVTPEAHVV